jgi:FAD/FMN-containing dehydrogenase
MMAGVTVEEHHKGLAAIVGAGNVLSPAPREYLSDGTLGRGLEGAADAVVLPGSAEEVAALMRYCDAHDFAITTRRRHRISPAARCRRADRPRHRTDGARARSTRCLADPRRGGRPTAELRRIARGERLWFPPDPGAAEQSQVGGNVATNAGGPHASSTGRPAHG